MEKTRELVDNPGMSGKYYPCAHRKVTHGRHIVLRFGPKSDVPTDWLDFTPLLMATNTGHRWVIVLEELAFLLCTN